MVDSVAFAGRLDFLNMGELLQLLGTIGGTGTLHIESQHAAQTGLIYIEKGNPINASNGSLTGLDALFSLFGWIDGQFEFVREDITCEKMINKTRMEIILDALRLLDEGNVEILGSAGAESKHLDTPAKSGSLPLIKGPLVDYTYVVDEEGFYDGDEIVHEGNHGNWIWVILEGVAQITKETPKGDLKLLRIGDGAFLGSVASLLKGDNVRSATITAEGNIQLGMLDSQLMTSELSNSSLDYRRFVESLDMRLKQVSAMTADIFAGCEKITEIVNDKKILLKQGQDERRLFRILSGEAYVAREIEGGIVPLVHLQKNDFLGHIPFLDMGHEPYSASVLASPDLKLTALDPDDLKREHDKLSSTLKNIISHLANCISVTTLIACDYYKKSFAKSQ